MRKYLWIYVIVTIIVSIWVVRYFLNRPIETQHVRYAQIEERVNADGYIVRDETVYMSASGGTVDSAVREGERVAKGMRIASVYRSGIDEKLKQEINEVDEMLAKLENTMPQKQLFGNDLVTVETRIKENVADIVKAARLGLYTQITVSKKAIDTLAGHRAEVAGADSPKQSTVAELTAKKKELEGRINSEKQEIYAAVGGVYSAKVDGYEGILRPDSIKDMTVAEFESIPAPREDNFTQTDTVEPGGAACKTVDNSNYMCVAVVSEADVHDIAEGNAVSLRFPKISEVLFPAKVEKIVVDPSGKALIVISANRALEGVYSIRNVNFDIVKRTHAGLSVPISALRIVDNKTGVFINRAGVAEFREADVRYKDETIAILSEGELKMYDAVVVNGDNVESGRVLE